MKRFTPYGVALAGAAILLFSFSMLFAPQIRAESDDEAGRLSFSIDVAQIGASNAQNNVDPREPAELFSRGDTAILSGTMYPKDTLQIGRQNNDPTEPGIGKYDYRAVYTDSPTSTTIVAFATESFQFSNDGATLLTDGLWPSEGSSADRVVLGGTGRFRDVVGEAHEENLGLNKDQFCNLRITFKLRKVTGRQH